MEPQIMHEALKPVEWLIGKWKSITSEGTYPNIQPFSYSEELTFTSLGQPLLNYNSKSWHPVKKTPMHLESGFLRIQPGTNNVAFMVAHNFGLTTLEEGTAEENRLVVTSKHISRTSFAKEPQVTKIVRSYKLAEGGNMEATILMETDKTPLQTHLKVLYEKC